MSLHMLTEEQIIAVEDYVNALAEEYVAEQKATAPRWWEFWKKIPTTRFHQVTQFLLKSLDGLINFVEPIIHAGTDKKSVVLTSVGKLFDLAIKEITPIWLRPFMPAIKAFIMTVVISNAIDFLVEKYREGEAARRDNNGTEENNS